MVNDLLGNGCQIYIKEALKKIFSSFLSLFEPLWSHDAKMLILKGRENPKEDSICHDVNVMYFPL
jgi:hypothetical protein